MIQLRNALMAIGLLAILSACGRDTEPTPYRLEQTIPLGSLELQVVDFEPVPAVHAPLSTLRTAPEDTAWALHVRWSGLDSLKDWERAALVEQFLEKRLWVTDMDGDRYRPIGAMARWLYRNTMVPPSTLERDWFVIFHAPEVSRDFTLFIKNPKPEAGEPALVSIVLAGGA